MTNDPMLNMWISFIGMGLMFVSVVVTIFAKEKLHGFLRYFLLTISFICLVVAGIIVFLTVFAGPTPE
ncbi:CHASE2 domain-containing sensor protein [Evansella vedderi]|uniref:CHASE2 domain-containing sensor protein n=1 Tax=Evansella vedderi TaxID=38282 RepID=A0ABU0A1Y0_9BACI|nr:DUF2768 domain-containing protein [Evansella vedderi]MDQ0257489.1 CHASE2 domain-containing sensor protein [Evansella vedderi]